MHTRCT